MRICAAYRRIWMEGARFLNKSGLIFRNHASERDTLKIALGLSFLLHIVFLMRLPFISSYYFKKPFNNHIEIYYKAKLGTQKAHAQREMKTQQKEDRKMQVVLEKEKNFSSFVKDITKLSKEFEINKKQPTKVSSAEKKHEILVEPLKSEEIQVPTYKNYYLLLRSAIKKRALANIDFSKFEKGGEVYLTCVVSSDGILKQIKIIEERTKASQYLKDVSLKSVQEASPFPRFSPNLNYPELTFSVAINYKITE